MYNDRQMFRSFYIEQSLGSRYSCTCDIVYLGWAKQSQETHEETEYVADTDLKMHIFDGIFHSDY